jgi:predicted lipid carrier protein YhbT
VPLIVGVAILTRRRDRSRRRSMATLDQCRTALHQLAERLAANADAGGRLDFDRSLACQVPDLDRAFHGRLENGRIIDLADGDDPQAKIRMIINSDDLLELVAGRLDAGKAFASGRLKIKASVMDLLKLRKLL